MRPHQSSVGGSCLMQAGMVDGKTKRARTDFRSAPEIAHFPPKIPFGCCGRWIDFPPEFDLAVCNELRGIKNMSERFSVCRGSLSPFVGCKLPFIFRFWKPFEVPFPDKWAQNRTQHPLTAELESEILPGHSVGRRVKPVHPLESGRHVGLIGGRDECQRAPQSEIRRALQGRGDRGIDPDHGADRGP